MTTDQVRWAEYAHREDPRVIASAPVLLSRNRSASVVREALRRLAPRRDSPITHPVTGGSVVTRETPRVAPGQIVAK